MRYCRLPASRSGEGAGVMEATDLVAIVEEMAELYEPAAQEAGFDLVLITAPTPPVNGSRELVSQAVANFLDNALKYATGGKRIELKVEPAKYRRCGPFSFRRRSRALTPRIAIAFLNDSFASKQSRSTPGSGLGLSLVAAIARAHGATHCVLKTALRPMTGLKAVIEDCESLWNFPAFAG